MTRNYSKSDLRALTLNGLGAELPALTKRRNLESEMQRALVVWWKDACKKFGVPELLLFSIPNGAAYGGTVEQRAKRGRFMMLEGQRRGVPDMFLSVCRFHGGMFGDTLPGLFLELKTPTGVLSIDQQTYHGVLRASGYRVEVCRTLEDAQKVITEYLK